MTDWLLSLPLVLVGILLTLACLLLGRWLLRGRSEKPQDAKSVMLAYLAERGYEDDKNTLEEIKKYVGLGAETENAREESAELRQLYSRLRDENERLQDEIHDLQEQVAQGDNAEPPESSGVAPVSVNPIAALDFVRSDARDRLNESLNDAADDPEVSGIINLTDLFEVLDREATFASDVSRADMEEAVEAYWFHAILRAQALVETYCPSADPGLTDGLRGVASGLLAIAARHGFHVTPIRLLVPHHTDFNETDEALGSLNGIAPIRTKLRALADVVSLGSDDLPPMMIDCPVSEVAEEGGRRRPAEGTCFRLEDWQVGK